MINEQVRDIRYFCKASKLGSTVIFYVSAGGITQAYIEARKFTRQCLGNFTKLFICQDELMRDYKIVVGRL